MTESPRFTLNRSLVILRHKQPFLDWLMVIEPDPSLTLTNVDDDCDAFLIPGEHVISCEADAVKWVEKRWSALFDHVLNDWITDRDAWPKKRSLQMFRQWFAIEYHSMVWDLDIRTPYETDEWDDDGEPEDDSRAMVH